MISKISVLSDELFTKLVNESCSISDFTRRLGYNNTGGGVYKSFYSKCKRLGIDYKEIFFENNKDNKGRKRTFEEIFCENSKINQTTVRSWYKKGNYSEYKCSICGITDWQGKPIILHMDHINGNNTDNRLENLRWVCPNCDTQLDTYCSKNKKNVCVFSGREYVPPKKNCIACGKPTTSSKKDTPLCLDCYKKSVSEHSKRPTKDVLIELLQKYPMVKIGEIYEVSDNAVRKWCKTYNLPYKKKDIKKYFEQENTPV